MSRIAIAMPLRKAGVPAAAWLHHPRAFPDGSWRPAAKAIGSLPVRRTEPRAAGPGWTTLTDREPGSTLQPQVSNTGNPAAILGGCIVCGGVQHLRGPSRESGQCS